MKYIIAIIQPDKLTDVRNKLIENEINLMTVSEVIGHGRQQGITQVFRGHKEAGSFLRKVKLEIAVNDEFLEKAVKAIHEAAHTGKAGDGKIFVMELQQVYRIHTGETGAVAIG
jgi:nitrogen regulatory protein PII